MEISKQQSLFKNSFIESITEIVLRLKMVVKLKGFRYIEWMNMVISKQQSLFNNSFIESITDIGFEIEDGKLKGFR